MKKIVMIFAAMAAVLSSCSKSELESVSVNDGKDIVLKISVSNPGADTKALIKSAWAANDEISIWYDTNTDTNPDLVITYDADNEKWIQKEGATVSGNNPTTGTGKYAKALYNGTVKVASKDDYTYDGTTLTFNIANWKFLTEIQVVVYGDDIDGTKPSDYTLSCDKFTPLASTGNGYTVNADGITASKRDKGAAITGIINDGVNSKSGVAFVFATAEYSSTAAAFKFTLIDNTTTPAVTKEYTATTNKISGTTGSMTAIKALAIASSQFNVPVNPLYVEIAAKYDGSNITTLKWHRQNLAITASGDMKWKGNNTSAVKVPGTSEDVKVGDYFQWAAYAGYCGDASAADKGLLIYNSFINKKCVENTGSSGFNFKSAGGSDKYRFHTSNSTGNIGISPYYSSGYQYYKDSSHSTLSRETSYTGHNDDVASIILSGDWRMPTTAEFQAMREATYWAWDATDCGYYVFMPNQGTSGAANARGDFNTESDDKTKALLFFPAAGFGTTTELRDAGSNGLYCSSSLNTGDTDDAYCVSFGNSGVNPSYRYYRYDGFSVRPVSE